MAGARPPRLHGTADGVRRPARAGRPAVMPRGADSAGSGRAPRGHASRRGFGRLGPDAPRSCLAARIRPARAGRPAVMPRGADSAVLSRTPRGHASRRGFGRLGPDAPRSCLAARIPKRAGCASRPLRPPSAVCRGGAGMRSAADHLAPDLDGLHRRVAASGPLLLLDEVGEEVGVGVLPALLLRFGECVETRRPSPSDRRSPSRRPRAPGPDPDTRPRTRPPR